MYRRFSSNPNIQTIYFFTNNRQGYTYRIQKKKVIDIIIVEI